MNEYKELIEALKCCFTDQKGCWRNCFACPYESFGNDCEDISLNALNAIEQLVKERDKLKLDLCEANDVIEYANDRLKKAEKERDALSEYISGLDCSNCGMRGMQE